MNIFHSLILGIIEGLTEFLPISSTAHMVLAADWLRIPTTDFLKTYEISIQLGAILAVTIIFWKKIWSSWNLIGKITAAFIPTAIIGLAFYKIVKNYLLGSTSIIAWALLLGGVIIIIFEKYYSKKHPEDGAVSAAAGSGTAASGSGEELSAITYKQAAIIGVFQALAIIPGVSRAGATIVGGLSLGVKRRDIVEFSFLLAIPTMVAATGLDLFESRKLLTGLSHYDLFIWLLGFLVAFITAIIGVRFFIRYIQKNNFVPFGWYRIVLGVIVLLWLFVK